MFLGLGATSWEPQKISLVRRQWGLQTQGPGLSVIPSSSKYEQVGTFTGPSGSQFLTIIERKGTSLLGKAMICFDISHIFLLLRK